MTAIETPQTVPTSGSGQTKLVKRLLRRPLTLASLIVLGIVALIAIVGPWIAPYDPNLASLQLILQPPSAEHVLGTDSAGRDVLSRLLAATQVSVGAALLALVTSLVIGVVSGLIAGYFHGWFDSVSSWTTSLLMALPGIVVLLAVQAVVGPSVWIAMLVFGVLISPAYFRLVYASVNAVREELYVDAARVAGLSDMRIIGRHVLSVVRAPIIIQSAIVAGITIAIQAGLEFLGLGDLSVPTWGQMLNDAFKNIYKEPTLMLWPSLAIAVTSIALTLLANGMRDELERTIPVRRRRRRAVTGATTSIAAVTTSISTSGGDAPIEDSGPIPVVGETIVHPDNEFAGIETLLSIKDLRVSYDQSDRSVVEVVHGVSLDIHRGEVHGLVGESGSGKTQTAFSVLGLLPRGGHVAGGTIDYQGVSLTSAGEKEYAGIRGTRIGYIPQEPMSNLDQAFTIGQHLVEPLRVRLGMSKKDATELALSLLDRVGIPNPKRTFDAYPFEVSGGMAQRVLIAGAVSTDPDLIIADEPTTALDVTVQAEVLDLLRDLQQEKGMAMLLVTHNFGVVADLCDRVTVMQQGLFVESGPVRTILRTPSHPYTQSLLGAILDEGPARPAYSAPQEGAQS
ncbi:ABC-type dipeptide/oligopeptide/nickel transport system ATPase component/ABC-type dipeptide/oligopeptide/nickel transport system permease subunit [Microbacterium endophyticum]|uniref:ABC-type dipeptide/oligopeptide/nickel transport system ATPase component/ABC-type dipeptide/oligopeptide/nickel transport system permease subunit n=1 Tax=Microbacterium endophyticum TaxID=1526412 RepID=A0A7W4YLW5_9MICO|nr:dipeptide/oligopeptide/nickel ABC transporter permease/ATP-binding protein [Microbacterium endophyticum]MBB2975850.1 ABC-type dipeptide/oligopeptide/nickel transport system ATPase component/ABC-type dipeptide/oligopeptide/nickel transport system permease subunit [Microbacterium endophyticum]NIK36333.1 ABC-type dipeptide/oligopeptide/nickel transport system ATPase component/ABC-type dipeptide/oligopeptide/nickel transport system permease subunit [Microbacterium endophyticum]